MRDPSATALRSLQAIARLAILMGWAGFAVPKPALGAGINLSWGDCGVHGDSLATFACNTNSGAAAIAVASFVPPAGVDAFSGMVATLVIESQHDLPDWWKFGNGQCRGAGGLATTFDFTATPSACGDPWEGQAVGGYVYEVGVGGPNRARLRVLAALPPGTEHPLDSGREYDAFQVRVQRSRTTGAGSCSGCDVPVRITLSSLEIDQPSGALVLTTPIDGATVDWQSGFGPLPEIDTMSPSAGAPGAAVTLAGTGFSGITSVRFNSTEAAFTVLSDTEIGTQVPADGRTGPVLVEGPQGIGASAADFVVAPRIDGFTPARAISGTTITISGVNFTATQRVLFNGLDAEFSVGSDTQLFATVPADATDGPITVIDAGGSAVSSSAFDVGPVTIRGQGTMDLSWDDCGTAGAQTKTFACNTNSGPAFPVMASFSAPEHIDQLVGLYAEIGVFGASAELPDWWKLGNGQCRQLSVLFDFTSGPFSCLDPWEGQAAGGAVYDLGYGGPDRSRLRVQAAIPEDLAAPLTTGSQYYAFRFLVPRAKSTGTGSCSGCDVPVCIGLQEIQLFQTAAAANDPVITQVGDRNYVLWQSATDLPQCAATAPHPVNGVPRFETAGLALERAWARHDGTTLSFTAILDASPDATLEVFDSSGRRVMEQRLAGLGAGRHEVRFIARQPLATGMYFARLAQGSRSTSRRFVVLR